MTGEVGTGAMAGALVVFGVLVVLVDFGFLVALAIDFVGVFLVVDLLVVFLVVGFLAAMFLVVVLVVFLVPDEGAACLGRRGLRPSIDLFFSIVYNYNIMSIKLTKKQLAVLEFLEDFTETEGYSPSYREIMAGLGLSSVSAVAEHVDNLIEKGVLRKVPGAARSLEILDYKHEETVKLFRERMVTCKEEEKKVLGEAAEILGLDLEGESKKNNNSEMVKLEETSK